MSQQVCITDPCHLPDVLDIIHDQWFEVQDIRFDEDHALVLIPFDRVEDTPPKKLLSFGRSSVSDTVPWVLEIRQAKRFDLHDTEQVGLYDFNEILYEPEKQLITITTGIPLDFTVEVSAFDLSVRKVKA